MTRVSDVVLNIEKATGRTLDGDEGVQHGDGTREFTGATVAWMATPDAIQAAGEAGHELLIVHESLYYPYDVIISKSPPHRWEEWLVNRQRRSLLEQYDLALLRLHSSADRICIFDVFAETLGLGDAVFADDLVKVYDIPPCPLRALVERVKLQTGMPHLRVSAAGDTNRTVSRVGLPWGGLGLFPNVGYQQALLEQGCDVFIAGESDNYGFRFAAECGIPMIETSHEVSENPGLRRLTGVLDEAFPDVQFAFYENECIWRMA
ncbi:MAG: Nif3-like dinuclear metal center hexameric protein [Planctomycetota bacterium]|jgi:putative NIF3 family GTP cyclohydrolase 1 type 2